jgi:hypothetical protein
VHDHPALTHDINIDDTERLGEDETLAGAASMVRDLDAAALES